MRFPVPGDKFDRMAFHYDDGASASPFVGTLSRGAEGQNGNQEGDAQVFHQEHFPSP
jgi:hypothetical protein